MSLRNMVALSREQGAEFTSWLVRTYSARCPNGTHYLIPPEDTTGAVRQDGAVHAHPDFWDVYQQEQA